MAAFKVIPEIGAGIAQKGHLWMETIYFYNSLKFI